MRDRDDDRFLESRNSADDDPALADDDPAAYSTQLLSTLREGYSWIRALEARHPGWRLHGVDDFCFTLPAKSLSESKVALVTLAGVYSRGQKPFNTSPGMVPRELQAQGFRHRGDWSLREIPADVDPSELSISHAHYDHSEGNEDINCIFPISRLIELETEGFVGENAEIHYSLMGYVPELHHIVETAARQLVPALSSRRVEVVLVAGGCELSHQSAAMVQREIEAGGIPTVGLSVCRDITFQLNVPRAVALKFPPGNPFGSSLDVTMQTRILKDALSLIDTADIPGEIVDLPYEWIQGS